jgi:hypothetical protein
VRRLLPLLGLLVACHPTTTRPDLLPVPDASRLEVELFVPEATRALALALDTDSIPVVRTEPEDGWLETDWFDATTLAPVRGRVVGLDAVRVRGFVDPARPNHSLIQVEVIYRPRLDPALPPRELEVMVPTGHPVRERVRRALGRLRAEYGEP